ncbi:hypothetical protein ACEZDB_24495 [Streptacidiphilus sp. N1-3]|uniref:Uncharacterized protein n=1 Tax=Streptacidiphilus alkalitolerans TaxID=3342712 RepID=A0ABV6X7G2_9ACTN
MLRDLAGALFPARRGRPAEGQPWTATVPARTSAVPPQEQWLLRSKQQPDGTWLWENTHPGSVPFALEEGDGRPSRWNTLRALRVLAWHGSAAV